jgi:hypothetical protein
MESIRQINTPVDSLRALGGHRGYVIHFESAEKTPISKRLLQYPEAM